MNPTDGPPTQPTEPAADPLAPFLPAVRTWFRQAFGQPTPPQVLGWPHIAAGEHTLILAPTGSGKTLAAFLWALDSVFREAGAGRGRPGVRVLYISPLKALNNDIHRNLQVPLEGIRAAARGLGEPLPEIRAAVRTGDTSAAARAQMVRTPPHVLVTTPESLYIMLTSEAAREIFRTVRHLIVDEIHAVCGTKRGVHLALTLERLEHLTDRPPVRVGLSATQRPLDEIARYLGGQAWADGGLAPRPVTIVDAGRRREMDLQVVSPVEDFHAIGEGSVWPRTFEHLHRLIERHRTTLVFANNRRLAERAAKRLNEIAAGPEARVVPDDGPPALGNYHVPQASVRLPTDRPPVRAHHGSMSREAREQMEAALKAGELPALVATSSLELGIDIGSIDLVCQLQSPKSVARGLQRVGRSGHLVGQRSTGRIFATFEEDLVESAVIARGMLDGAVEETRVPRHCLDVLAQQIVAMVAADEWETDALYRLVRQAYPYRDLPRPAFTSVVEMLAGAYPREEFRELRPRIAWDRVHDRVLPLPGSRMLAVRSGGTIPDRGYYAVVLAGSGVRLGELDEEFVYESRVGDAFLLGSTTWRIGEIQHDRVIVTPAPGSPPRLPFWKGEFMARPYELSLRVGAFRRELAGRLDDPDLGAWLRDGHRVDARGAAILRDYVAAQLEATGAVPSDRTVVVESFRDELDTPRIAVHSTFGAKVNAPWSMAIAARLRQELGVEVQAQYTDDGMLFQVPDAESVPPIEAALAMTAEEVEEAVLAELGEAALFGALFRQNAERALLLPRRRTRTPFWLQRLRAADLLQVARRHDGFPIVVETYRDCLRDVLDLDALRQVIAGIRRGEIAVHRVETAAPSPATAGLLFQFIGVYMYADETPRAERASQMLALNRELLQQILSEGDLRELLRPEAVAEVETRLQHLLPASRARTPEELVLLLHDLGDLRDDEIAARSRDDPASHLARLAAAGRVARAALGDDSRWIAAEEAALYRAVFGDAAISAPPPAVPGPAPSCDEARRLLVRRMLRTHGPLSAAAIVARYPIGRAEVEALLHDLERAGAIARGPFARDAGAQWCDRENLRRIHRRTLAILRREVQPVSPERFVAFALRWQHVHPDARLAGAAGLRRVLSQLHGVPLPGDAWDAQVLPARLLDYEPAALTGLTTTGEVVWMGAGPRSPGRFRFVLRGQGGVFLDGEPDVPLGPRARAVREALTQGGASFFADLEIATGLPPSEVAQGLMELVWLGEVTNDSFAAMREVLRAGRAPGQPEDDDARWPIASRRRDRARLRRSVLHRLGRWTLVRVPGVLGPPRGLDERARAQALGLLARYGVLTREWHAREEGLLPWPLLAHELRRMELRGEVRRGYFVQGLSGVQYALPEAVERLRGSPADDARPLVLSAVDPASPFGGHGLPLLDAWGEAVRLPRIASNLIVLAGGRPVLAVELAGRRLVPLQSGGPDDLRDALRALVESLGRRGDRRRVEVETWGSTRADRGDGARLLRDAGFVWDGEKMVHAG